MSTPAQFEKALNELFKKVQYLASKGIINKKGVDDYKWIINTLKDAYMNMDADKTEAELSQSVMLDQNNKLKMLLRMCGLRQTAIEKYKEFPIGFLQTQMDYMVESANFLISDINCLELEGNFNTYNNAIQRDIQIITEYRELAQSNITIKSDIQKMLRESFPHLTEFFNHIDLDPSKEIRDLNVKIRSHYVG